MAHGQAAADAAKAATAAMFGGGGAAASAPSFATTFPVSVLDVMVGAELAKSKGAARRLVKQGGVRLEVGGEKSVVTDGEAMIEGPVVLWKGKKSPLRVVASD